MDLTGNGSLAYCPKTLTTYYKFGHSVIPPPKVKGPIYPSDRRSQYFSYSYKKILH